MEDEFALLGDRPEVPGGGAAADSPLCLGTTGTGEPRHPLHVPRDAPLVPWSAP